MKSTIRALVPGAFGLMALALPAGAANAAPLLSAGQLAEACSNGELYYTYGKCAGYIAAAYDQHVEAPLSVARICLPEGILVEGLLEPVTDYLAARPKRADEPAARLVIEALWAAFPCA